MASKRVLYQPAPSSGDREGGGGGDVSSKRAARRTLVQGRLVTDSGPFSGRRGRDESPDDPTILPANSLPMLTEGISPRPEPLQCLDLSDSDADNPHSLNRPKPVLVFDASRQKDLSYGAELEVVVGYEDSPARVVCHTPGKLERSFLEERRVGHDFAYSGGDGPNWAVKVDMVHNVSGLGSMAEKSSPVSLGASGLKKIKEARNRSHDASAYNRHQNRGIIEEILVQELHQNRGIIEEILVQELGSSNLEAISLESETTGLSPQSITCASSSDKSQHSSENRGNEGLPSLSSHRPNPTVLSGSSPTKHQKGKVKNKASFPQPRFENDSDTSPDRVPVKEAASSQQARICDEHSGSETCSLYEYVPSNKSQEKRADQDRMVEASSKNLQDGGKIEVSKPTKKVQKTRKVASRYLQSSVNKASVLPSKNPSSDPSLPRPYPRSQPSARALSKQSREKLQAAATTSKKPASGKSSRDKNVLPMKASNSRTPIVVPTQQSSSMVPTHTNLPPMKASNYGTPIVVPTQQSFTRADSPQEVLTTSESSSKDQKTSTPTHDQVCHLSQDIDASAIQSVSTMSMNMSCAGVPRHWPSIFENVDKKFAPEKLSSKRDNNPPTGRAAMSKPQRSSQQQLDLEYSRFLQMAFLSCKARKAYEQQDNTAQTQVHELWKVVESAREKNTQLKMDVSRLDGLIKQDILLNMIETDLDTVMPLVPQLEAAYSRLSLELDTTRHQLPTRDVYIPAEGNEERDLYEDQLKAALTESDLLLEQLTELTDQKIQPLGKYLASAEAIDSNVCGMYETLENSQNDVTAIQGLTTRLTSLYVQDL